MTKWRDLFTPRQLVALTTFSDLVAEAMERVERDAANADLPNDERTLRDGGAGATAYAEAVGVYLAFATDKAKDRNSALCSWAKDRVNMRQQHFRRQAITNGMGFRLRAIRFARNSELVTSTGASVR